MSSNSIIWTLMCPMHPMQCFVAPNIEYVYHQLITKVDYGLFLWSIADNQLVLRLLIRRESEIICHFRPGPVRAQCGTLWSDAVNSHTGRMTGGSKNRNSRNPRNPPKFTKSSVYKSILSSQIPLSATKSTYMKRKLSKCNVSSHESNGFHEIQYSLRNPHHRMPSIDNIRLC